jgi:hypothetical protein
MTDIQVKNLHGFLHNATIKFMTINGNRIPIYENREGLRYIVVNGVKYIQQNPKKETSWGKMASNGHRITWGIRDGKWDLIVDDQVKVFNGQTL